MTIKRAGKSRFRGTTWATVLAGLALFALMLAGVGFAGGQVDDGSNDEAVLVLDRRQVSSTTGSGDVSSTGTAQVQQAPASPPKTATKTTSARKSRGS